MADPIAFDASSAAGWLLTYLLHSTVLLLAAEILGRTVARAPSLRDGLGKAAMVGSVATASVASFAGAGPMVEVTRAVVVRGPVEWVADVHTTDLLRGGVMHTTDLLRGGVVPAGEAPSGDGLAPVGGVRLGLTEAESDRVDAMLAELRGSASAADRNRAWPWALVSVWLVAALVGLARMARARRAVGIVRGTLTAASPRAVRMVGRLAPDMAGRLRSSSSIETPCVLPGGIVVLSERAERALDDDGLNAVLAHEVAHVVRRDPGWFTGLEGLCAVLGVQPLNRVVFRSLRANAELACDDWAVGRTGSPTDLARTIATVAEWGSAPAHAGVVPMSRRGGGAAERVERLLRAERGRRWSPWSAGGLGALLLFSGLQLPAVRPPGVLHATFFEADVDAGAVTELVVRGEEGPPVGDRRFRAARIVVRTLEEG